jgi:hypothetical protein
MNKPHQIKISTAYGMRTGVRLEKEDVEALVKEGMRPGVGNKRVVDADLLKSASAIAFGDGSER